MRFFVLDPFRLLQHIAPTHSIMHTPAHDSGTAIATTVPVDRAPLLPLVVPQEGKDATVQHARCEHEQTQETAEGLTLANAMVDGDAFGSDSVTDADGVLDREPTTCKGATERDIEMVGEAVCRLVADEVFECEIVKEMVFE